MIKYLGSKRLLLPQILAAVAEVEGARSVLDLFSGTSRVGHALKQAGYRVIANDWNGYAATLARCYVVADRETHAEPASSLIAELQQLEPKPGWFTETYCERSRYLQANNGAKVEAIREAIAALALEPVLESVLLVSLLEAADRVDSTTGVQMAYLKQWSARSHKPLTLRVPDLLPRSPQGPGEAHQLDAQLAARTLSADVAYLDPPYNQHSYLGNYHVWESLIRWDAPEVYGIACKRTEVRERRSPFNSKRRCAEAMRELIEAVDARVLIVSFSNEGFIEREAMETMLAVRGPVRTFEHDYKRYVGAQIGIHNPAGEKVGQVSHLRNTEYLYIVGAPERKIVVDLAPASSATQDQIELPGLEGDSR
ncbi:DNA adenine methylase [Nannocystaceae bacterium ST9]